jgi:hypothetical protein
MFDPNGVVAGKWFDDLAVASGWFDTDTRGSATGAYSVTITAGTVPLTGAGRARLCHPRDDHGGHGPRYRGHSHSGPTGIRDSVTAGTVPLTGQTVSPVYAITEAITAGTVALTGSSRHRCLRADGQRYGGHRPDHGADRQPCIRLRRHDHGRHGRHYRRDRHARLRAD